MNSESRITKIGALIILVTLVFLIGMAIRSCGSDDDKPKDNSATPAQRIEEVLSFGHVVLKEAYSFESNIGSDNLNRYTDLAAVAEKQYVESMYRHLSTIPLPEDIQYLFLQHISAHNRYADKLRDHPRFPNGSGFWDIAEVAFGNWLMGKMDGGGGEMMSWDNERKRLEADISETWDAVLQCAIKYGAQIKTEE